MKTLSLFKRSFLAALLLVPFLTFGATQTETPVDKKVQESTTKVLSEKRQAILSEATQALQETNIALKALDTGKKKEALKSLERATGRSVPIDVDRPADGRYKVIDSLSNRYFGDLVVSDQSVRFDGSLKGNVM